MGAIDFGTVKSVETHGRYSSSVTTIKKIRNGKVAIKVKLYKERLKVKSAEEERRYYVRFSAAISAKREAGSLAIDKEEPATIPAFMVEFPKTNTDGSYFVVMSWAEH